MSEELIRLGLVDDGEIVLDTAALRLGRVEHSHTDLTPNEELIEALAIRLEAVGAGADSERERERERADVLSHVIARSSDFGDRESYDDPGNADLIRVLDRRRSLPVSLSILYVAAARRLGRAANVLDLPGHVLVLIGNDASAVDADPFEGSVLVPCDQLGAMVTAISPVATGTVRRITAMPNRFVLITLLLNQATRAERAGRGRRASNFMPG